MPSPFSPYANLRILIPRPAASLTFRGGSPPPNGHWLIHCYAPGPTTGATDLPTVSPRVRSLAGYITAWALLPTGGNWLAATTGFTWETTGLAPSGLRIGMGGRGFLGALPDLPTKTGTWQEGEATITSLSGQFGPGGIGAQIRARAGDAITIELQVTA